MIVCGICLYDDQKIGFENFFIPVALSHLRRFTIKMKNAIDNKVVVITGASSGIGKACAFAFAKEKARVMLAARDELKLKEIAEQGAAQAGKSATRHPRQGALTFGPSQ